MPVTTFVTITKAELHEIKECLEAIRYGGESFTIIASDDIITIRDNGGMKIATIHRLELNS